MTMARIINLPKHELLLVLEYTPQRFWPPRPTRQDKRILAEAIEHAHYLGGSEGERVRGALAEAWRRQRESEEAIMSKQATAGMKLYEFTVEGAGEFPLDMLRYDQCYPYSAVDSALMHREHSERRRIVLQSCSRRMPSRERWQSFTWTIVQVGPPRSGIRELPKSPAPDKTN
jgi:hypothetical protein